MADQAQAGAAAKRRKRGPNQLKVIISQRAKWEMRRLGEELSYELEGEGRPIPDGAKRGASYAVAWLTSWFLSLPAGERDRILREGEKEWCRLEAESAAKAPPAPPSPGAAASTALEGRRAGGTVETNVLPGQPAGDQDALRVHEAPEPERAPRRVRRKR